MSNLGDFQKTQNLEYRISEIRDFKNLGDFENLVRIPALNWTTKAPDFIYLSKSCSWSSSLWRFLMIVTIISPIVMKIIPQPNTIMNKIQIWPSNSPCSDVSDLRYWISVQTEPSKSNMWNLPRALVLIVAWQMMVMRCSPVQYINIRTCRWIVRDW